MGAVLVLPLIFVPVVIVCSIIGIILGIYYFVKRTKAKNKEEEKKAKKEGLITVRANPNNHDIYYNNKKAVF